MAEHRWWQGLLYGICGRPPLIDDRTDHALNRANGLRLFYHAHLPGNGWETTTVLFCPTPQWESTCTPRGHEKKVRFLIMRLAGVTRSASELHEDFLAGVGSFYDAYTVLVMLYNGLFHFECYLWMLSLLLKF